MIIHRFDFHDRLNNVNPIIINTLHKEFRVMFNHSMGEAVGHVLAYIGIGGGILLIGTIGTLLVGEILHKNP